MASHARRISVGFQGGQVLALGVPQEVIQLPEVRRVYLGT